MQLTHWQKPTVPIPVPNAYSDFRARLFFLTTIGDDTYANLIDLKPSSIPRRVNGLRGGQWKWNKSDINGYFLIKYELTTATEIRLFAPDADAIEQAVDPTQMPLDCSRFGPDRRIPWLKGNTSDLWKFFASKTDAIWKPQPGEPLTKVE
jgi:hypothetical protein